MMKFVFKKNIFLILFVLIFSGISYAQPPDFGGNDGTDEPNDAPISGLVALSLVIGSFIGIKKYK